MTTSDKPDARFIFGRIGQGEPDDIAIGIEWRHPREVKLDSPAELNGAELLEGHTLLFGAIDLGGDIVERGTFRATA